ncbi:MAG: amidohydrolase family protein, partial [Armatimonadetes bacterium]|nr:amidohydrolase family protein [Armatimonadota bacterium]
LHTLGMPPEAWPKPGEVLRAATRGGARVLRLEGRVGMIAPGYRADLMVLRADQPALTPLTDPHAQLVYASEGRGVDTVIVDGRVVVRSGRVCTVDRQALLDEAAEAGRVFLARNAERFALARRIAAAVAAALAGDAWAFR